MNPDSTEQEEKRVRCEAAEWLVKHDRGLTAAEQDEFFQWLARDARHGAWFAQHRAGWQRLDGIAGWQPQHSPQPNPDVLARPARRSRWPRALWLAAGAAAVISVGLWSLSGRMRMRGPDAAERAGSSARIGGYERRVLEDGSVAELTGGAEIDVDYTAQERRVVLREGEALFTVAKNPQRPFTVRVQDIDVRAVGTAFSVRLQAGAVEVLVTEGRVQVAPPGSTRQEAGPKPPLVLAGQRAVVPLGVGTAAQVSRASSADLARLQAWQPHLLDFSSTPLDQVISEFNIRNRTQIVLRAPGVESIPIVASIRSDNIDGFVRLIASTAQLRAERTGDYEIVLLPNP